MSFLKYWWKLQIVYLFQRPVTLSIVFKSLSNLACYFYLQSTNIILLYEIKKIWIGLKTEFIVKYSGVHLEYFSFSKGVLVESAGFWIWHSPCFVLWTFGWQWRVRLCTIRQRTYTSKVRKYQLCRRNSFTKTATLRMETYRASLFESSSGPVRASISKEIFQWPEPENKNCGKCIAYIEHESLLPVLLLNLYIVA